MWFKVEGRGVGCALQFSGLGSTVESKRLEHIALMGDLSRWRHHTISDVF